MTTLKKGDPAPAFNALDQNGNRISLSQFKGKKIVLYFYPKDDTPGCTSEACNLRDNHLALLKKGFVVIGVSADNAQSHTKFQQKYDLPFPLIADEDKTVIKAYGAWGEKKMYGKGYEGILRTTFVIDEQLRILMVIDKVNTKDPTAQILEEIN